MHSAFETAPSAPAIPITFATKTTWDAIHDALPAPARRFALANDFAAKPGSCLALPAADGQIARIVAGPAAAGDLSLCQCAARHAACHTRFCARQLPVRPLPQG